MSTAALFERLVDDAAVFPPGDLALEEAVPAHRRHRNAAYSSIVGTFVCADDQLPSVSRLAGDEPLEVSVVIGGGAGGIESAVGYARRTENVRVRGVEVRLRDEDDLSRNAQRVAAMCASCVDDEEVFVETGLEGGWERALDVVASSGFAAKLRTGGLSSSLFPSCEQVAAFITACLDREIAFKCTAGLHNAVRHTDPATGFEHHGFLNMLVATRASLDGATGAEVAGVLESRSGVELAAAVKDAEGARRWFRSFGSCSIDEPVKDLTALGLVTA